MNYRAVSTSIWTDDAILELSPEQKLVFLYLHTNPYASACGIYRLHLKTMSFQIGMGQDSFESALRGLCAVLPDFIAADFDVMEVGLLQYPKQTLIAASASQMKHVSKEIENIGSQYLIRELIARNSATISAPYLSQLRRLQMTAINRAKNEADVNAILCGDVAKVVEYEETNEQTQTQTQTQTQEQTDARAPEKIDFVTVANLMEQHVNGEGKDQWEAMCQASGYKGKPITVFMNWAGKANDYQLRNWKAEIPRLLTWMRNEARADYVTEKKAQGYQPVQPQPAPNTTRIHRKTHVS